MDMFDFAGLLFGNSRTAPDATTVTATGAGASDGGEVGITLDADVTPAEDTGVEGDADQTIIDLPTSPVVDEGDELIVTLVGDGPLKTPVVTANPGSGDRMRALANSAKTVADAAQAVAEAVNQHFFSDTNGIHVTEATQEDWDVSHSGANVLINSIGQLFRDGLNNLLTLTTENGARALTIWDGLGNEADNILGQFSADRIRIGEADGYNVTIEPASIDFNHSDTMVSNITSSVETEETEYEVKTVSRNALNYGHDGWAVIEGEEENYVDLESTLRQWHNRLTLKTLDNHKPSGEADAGRLEHEPYIELHTNRWVSSSDSYVSDDITFKTETWVVWDLQNKLRGSIDPRSYFIDSHDAAIALRSPVGTYTGTNNTATASAAGWQLTYFNTVVAEVGSPRVSDYHFTNGVLTATRDCVLEISGVMNWYDAIAGLRGFGIFEGTTAGSGTEHSSFQAFAANVTGNRKSVVFPPKLFTLTAGSSLTFGRYQQQGAVYQNGTNFSWVTIRVVG